MQAIICSYISYSRDPNLAFTAGQFMTERPGGSDVSQTETVARPIDPRNSDKPGSQYILNGFKWFSSATDGEVALVLARTGDPAHGSRSLSLFLLPLRLPIPTSNEPTPSGILRRTPSTSNGILVHRLKHKFGTTSVPTAELSLNDSVAYLVGPLNQGVKAISTVLQITRVHSAFHSVGSLARALSIARSYANVRKIEGGTRLLNEVPLHLATLANVAVTYRALVHLAFGVAHLLGKIETNVATKSEISRFRLLNPTVKAFAAHHCIPSLVECMSAMGGEGYMEENDIPRLIRDAMVENIWEGTINVLSLDLVRAVEKDTTSLQDYIIVSTLLWNSFYYSSTSKWSTSFIRATPSRLRERIESATSSLGDALKLLPSLLRDGSKRSWLYRKTLLIFGHISAAVYLLEHLLWTYSNNEPDVDIYVSTFKSWVENNQLSSLIDQWKHESTMKPSRSETDYEIIYGKKRNLSKL